MVTTIARSPVGTVRKTNHPETKRAYKSQPKSQPRMMQGCAFPSSRRLPVAEATAEARRTQRIGANMYSKINR